MDLSDFRIKGKQGPKKERKKMWSHKLLAPGRRWVTVCNAKGGTEWVSGPHSPKQYDGDLLIYSAKTIDRLFEGGTVVADNHFRKAT